MADIDEEIEQSPSQVLDDSNIDEDEPFEEEFDDDISVIKYFKLSDGKSHQISDVKNRENVDKFVANLKASISIEDNDDDTKTLNINIGNIDYENVNK